MKTTTTLSIIFLIAAMAGCSDPKAEQQEASKAAMQQFLNQNPEGRISSMEEAKNLDPNTGKPILDGAKNLSTKKLITFPKACPRHF